jgi:ribonuclease-3
LTRAGDWCKDRLHYEFRDDELLEQALTHRSAAADHNERLEFLGDAALGMIIAQALFHAYPESREGALSRYRARLVRRETLAEIAAELELGERLVMGGGERRTGGRQRASVLADALEAVFGAILLDGGHAELCRVIDALFASRIASLPPEAELLDAKTALQEYLQARGMRPPEYALEATTGAAHRQQFTASCSIDALEIHVQGQAGSRRKAEQQAAARALEQLQDE